MGSEYHYNPAVRIVSVVFLLATVVFALYIIRAGSGRGTTDLMFGWVMGVVPLLFATYGVIYAHGHVKLFDTHLVIGNLLWKRTIPLSQVRKITLENLPGQMKPQNVLTVSLAFAVSPGWTAGYLVRPLTLNLETVSGKSYALRYVDRWEEFISQLKYLHEQASVDIEAEAHGVFRVKRPLIKQHYTAIVIGSIFLVLCALAIRIEGYSHALGVAALFWMLFIGSAITILLGLKKLGVFFQDDRIEIRRPNHMAAVICSELRFPRSRMPYQDITDLRFEEIARTRILRATEEISLVHKGRKIRFYNILDDFDLFVKQISDHCRPLGGVDDEKN